LHQLQNKPWATLYVACLFYAYFTWRTCIFMVFNKLLGGLFQCYLVMQGITAYLPVGSILFFYFIDYAVFILITFCVVNQRLFAEDKLIAAKLAT
jgi:hypothetical protein